MNYSMTAVLGLLLSISMRLVFSHGGGAPPSSLGSSRLQSSPTARLALQRSQMIKSK